MYAETSATKILDAVASRIEGVWNKRIIPSVVARHNLGRYIFTEPIFRLVVSQNGFLIFFLPSLSAYTLIK